MMAMRNTIPNGAGASVPTIDHFGVHLNQPSALGDQLTQFPDVYRRYPDFGNQIGGQQAGQDERSPVIGLGTCCGNLPNAESFPFGDRVGHFDLCHAGCQQIVDLPGVGR